MMRYPKAAGIYKLTCIINSKSYIGKSVNLYKRINRHKNCHIKHNKKGFLQNAILKYGWDSFVVEILEVFDDFNKHLDNNRLLQRESYYIELLDTTNRDKGYNICKYSTDSTGRKLTEEHKEKIRQSHLGKVYSADHREKIKIGKAKNPMSEESKEKLRQINLGKTMSNDARNKMSIARTGKTHSLETREKIRQGNLGKIVSDETKEKMRNAISDETKQKLSKLYKGIPRSEETKEKIKLTKQQNRKNKI